MFFPLNMSKYYILTQSAEKHVFAPFCLPVGVAFMYGQLELPESGYLHWQFVLYTENKCRSSFVRRVFPSAHVEVTRSSRAESYCQKDASGVEGTQFELGVRPFRRNKKADWDRIWDDAKAGKILDIPSDVRIRCYSTIRRIEKDYMEPQAIEKQVQVFWGTTGTGKSRRAWEEAGLDAYPKDPKTKFWDGYGSQRHVVIDEFRGAIDISHMLRWLDRYPTIVEVKGGAVVFKARCIWITSNISPESWYPDLDEETKAALRRRLRVTHFN